MNIICDFCSSRDFNEVYSDGTKFKVLKCTSCKLAFLHPRPSGKEIEDYYQNNYFKSGLANTGYTSYNQLDEELYLEARQRLKIINKYTSPKSLLDVGCGYGHFLASAREQGYKVMGFDISREAIQKLKNQFNIEGRVGNVDSDLPQSKFSIITSWDVVEHFPHPLTSLKSLNKIQNRGDYFFFTTPNIESIDARLLGRLWYGFKRIPEHLYFFSPQTITNYLHKSGYDVLEVKNWGFYRNVGYCVDQIARYNHPIYKVADSLSRFLNLRNKSFFFPIIDMFVIARKL